MLHPLRVATTIAGAAVVMLGPRPAAAASDTLLVSAAWLAERLDDPAIVVVHVAGSRSDYDRAHVPGARFLAYESFVAEGGDHGQGLATELPTHDRLVESLEAIGVSSGSRIVLYGSRAPITARLFMTLDYLGLGGRTSVLDGGLAAWRKDGRPVSREAPRVTRGTLKVAPRADVVVDAAWLVANQGDQALRVLDARTSDFYTGSAPADMHSPRPGHIPGAVNIPFVSLVAGDGTFEDRATLAAMFQQKGVAPGSRVVTYCHIGQQGSLLYFVARHLGYDARLYDGSFEDWSRRTELPVVTGSSPR